MRDKGGRAFHYYLAGQGISNLGDSFRFVAVTILVLKLTGSGMEAALGLAASSLPSILLSPFAGVLGDRIDERRLLILIDFLRFPVVPLFISARCVEQIYFLLILLSLFDVFYSPSRRKFILGMTGREGALKANSLLTGVSGAAYLAGPLAAGFLTDAYGAAPAIMIAGVCCLCSCILTMAAGILHGREALRHQAATKRRNMPPAGKRDPDVKKGPAGMQPFPGELRKGIEYCLSAPDIRTLLIIGLIVGFSTISVNLSFYPYAFDVLKVTARGWSLMITVYYGTNLLATLLLECFREHFKRSGGRLFYGGLCIISAIWALYAVTRNLACVLLLQFIEGTVIAVCGILLAARFQTITDKGFMARVSGANDIVSNTGKLAGMGCTALMTGRFSHGAVFILNSTLLFLLAFSGLLFSRWARGSSLTANGIGR